MRQILLIALLVLPVSAFSSGYLTPLGTGIAIDKVHANADGSITLWINSSSISNPDNCGRTDKVHIKAIGGYETLVSVVLTAFAMEKKLGLWSNGCEIIPFWGGTLTFPVANYVWVTD